MKSMMGAGLAALAVVAFFLASVSWAGGGATHKVGDKVTKIEGVDETGKTWSADGILGKKTLVLYFFPADFTNGCTAQACSFRDHIKDLSKHGVEVIGVSGDSPETHSKFRESHELTFHMLADEKGELAKQFGVPVGKGGSVKFTNKKTGAEEVAVRGVTIQRHTVVIGPDGTILAIDPVKNAAGDSERILKMVSKSATE